MNEFKNIPSIIREISYDGIQRVVAGLEGDWNPTMVTIWTRNKGTLGFSHVTRAHSTFKPSLELYFKRSWVGIHCYKRINGYNVFDEENAAEILKYITVKCRLNFPPER